MRSEETHTELVQSESLAGAAEPAPVVLASSSVMPAQPGSSDWPRFGYDLRNTRFNKLETQVGRNNVARLKAKWEFDAGAPIQNTPAVIGDTLYFGTHGGDFFALDTRTGSRKWHVSMGEPHPEHLRFLRSSPEYAGGRLYFGAGRAVDGADHAVAYCLDAATGKTIWRTKLDEKAGEHDTLVTCSVTLFDGKIFVGTSGGGRGQVLCLDAADGQVRWRFQTVPEIELGGGGVWTSPAIDEEHGLVYNGTGDAKAFISGPVLFSESIIANDIATGELRWYYQARQPDVYYNLDFSCHPMLFDAVHPDRPGAVRKCVGAGNKGGFYTVDRHTGEFYWKVMLTNHSGATGLQLNSTAVAYNRVFAVSNASGVRRPPSSVTAGLNAYTGDIEWWVHNEATNQAPVAVANGLFYQGLMDGRLQALDTDTGELLWEYKLPSGHRGGIAIANGAIYGSNGGPFRREQTKKYVMQCFTIDGE